MQIRSMLLENKLDKHLVLSRIKLFQADLIYTILS
nr:MAG TPA: hypothetical protein [Bacteriophage sp.]